MKIDTYTLCLASLVACTALGGLAIVKKTSAQTDVATDMVVYYDFEGDLTDKSVTGFAGASTQANDGTWSGAGSPLFLDGTNHPGYGDPTLPDSSPNPNFTGVGSSQTFWGGLFGQSVFLGGDDGNEDLIRIADASDLLFGDATDFSISYWGRMPEDQSIANSGEEGDGFYAPSVFTNKNDWAASRRSLPDNEYVDNSVDNRPPQNNPGFAVGWDPARGDDYQVNLQGAGDAANLPDPVDFETGSPDIGFGSETSWFHVAITVDRDGLLNIYQDGAVVESLDISTSSGTIDTGLGWTIGGDPAGGDGGDASLDTYWGSLDDFAVWSGRLLDADEIADIYAAGDQFGKSLADLNAGFVLPQAAGDAIFTGADLANNDATDADNWQDSNAPSTWVTPGQDANNDGIPDFVGGTRVLIGAGTSELDPVVYNDTETRTVSNFVIGATADDSEAVSFDQTVYVDMTDGQLVGQGDANSFIGAGGSVVMTMSGDAKLDHNGGAEEESELQIGDGDESASVVLTMSGTSEIASGNYNQVVAGDPNDPFASNRVLDVRRRRTGDLGLNPDLTPIDPQRWGDDIKVGEGANVDMTMNENSRMVATDVFYINDQPEADAEVNLTLNDNASLQVMWDTRVHDDPQVSRSVINLNDNSRFIAGFDQALGEAATQYIAGGSAISGRERYEIELNINDDAQFLAGDRIWFGAGADLFLEGESLQGEMFQTAFDDDGVEAGTYVLGKVDVNLSGNGLIKAGNDDGSFNAVDGTGTDAIVRVGDFFIQMGHGGDVDVTIDGAGAVMEATRHIFVGSGRIGRANVEQTDGLVQTLGTAQGSITQPFALAGNSADLNYRPERGWLDEGGQIAVGYDTEGSYQALGGTLAPATELLVGALGRISEAGGGNGYLLIDGGNVAVGRDTYIGDLGQINDRGQVIATPKGEIEYRSGQLTTRDLVVGNEGDGIFTLVSAPAGPAPLDAGTSAIEVAGDISFGGNFLGATPTGSGLLDVRLNSADVTVIDGVGGAFASGTSLSNLLIWNGALDVVIDSLYADYRPVTGETITVIEYGGNRTGTFDVIADPAEDGIVWDVAYNDPSDEQPVGGVDLVASIVAIAGDANFDGSVDPQDVSALVSNFGATDANWSQADFNNDSVIDPSDVSILVSQFGQTGAASPAIEVLAASVPEPTTLALAALGLAGLAVRRRSN